MFQDSVWLAGDEIVPFYQDTQNEMGGFIDCLRQEGIEIVPSIAAHAVSSGRAAEAVYREVLETVLQDIARYPDLDGVLLAMHGAFLCEHTDDATGDFLEEIRRHCGHVIGVTLDLHANMTEKIARNCDVLVGFHTYPHVDLYETGYKAAHLLVRLIKGEISIHIGFRKLPLIVNSEAAQTTSEPMKGLIDRAQALESLEGVYSASVFQVQPWYDVYDLGCATVALAESRETADRYADDLGEMFWGKRREFIFETHSIDELIEKAKEPHNTPLIMADSADGTGSGSTGDSNYIIDHLSRKAPELLCYVSITDRRAVADAISAGVGNEVELMLGGSIDTVNFEPIPLRVYIKSLSDGVFTYKGPQMHGRKAYLGKTAVVVHGGLHIVIMENSAFNWDPELYRSQGLEPRDADIVVVKSPCAFRAAYEGISDRMYLLDAPGVSGAHFAAMDFRRIRRPLYPFDDL